MFNNPKTKIQYLMEDAEEIKDYMYDNLIYGSKDQVYSTRNYWAEWNLFRDANQLISAAPLFLGENQCSPVK